MSASLSEPARPASSPTACAFCTKPRNSVRAYVIAQRPAILSGGVEHDAEEARALHVVDKGEIGISIGQEDADEPHVAASRALPSRSMVARASPPAKKPILT